MIEQNSAVIFYANTHAQFIRMFLSLSKVQKFIHSTEEVVLLSHFVQQIAILMFDFYGELKPKTSKRVGKVQVF